MNGEEMNINKLEDRELDAVVAKELFDRPPYYYDCPHFDKNGRILSFCSCPDLPRYSRYIATAYLAEKRIEELGLIDEYCIHLSRIVFPYNKDTHLPLGWYLIHASPKDRCHAMLMAVMENE